MYFEFIVYFIDGEEKVVQSNDCNDAVKLRNEWIESQKDETNGIRAISRIQAMRN